MSTIESLPALKRRLSALHLQKARHGINADPAVTNEAQDLETVIHQMERIDIHRASLAHLLKQRDQHGLHVPPHVVASIAQARQEIATLRAACSHYGHAVASHPVDSDEVVVAPTPVEPVPVPLDPLAEVRERLRDLETFIRRGMPDHALALVRELQALLR